MLVNVDQKMETIQQKLEVLHSDTFDSAAYWQHANDGLVHGYNLPVAMQNILDDVNLSFIEALKECGKPIHELSRREVVDIARTTNFDGLEQLITLTGVQHHYHQTAGADKQYRVKMDLKIIPTVMNNVGQPIAAVAFISITFETGKIIYGESDPGNTFYYIPIIRIIGREDLKHSHEPLHRLQVTVVPNFTNDLLGFWLKRLRTLDVEELLFLDDYTKATQ